LKTSSRTDFTRDLKTAASTRLRLRVTATAESILRSGHPWLFADSIRAQNREGRLGELAAIYDRRDRFLAIGLFDPDSPLRVRVLHAGKPDTIDLAWWQKRLRSARQRREGLFDDQTTGHRWINGESDGWPGLVLDRYDTTLVLKLYTAAWLPRLGELIPVVREALQPQRCVLRLSRNIQAKARRDFQLADGDELGWSSDEPAGGRAVPTPHPTCASDHKLTDLDSPVLFLETGLRFDAEVRHGQKTGFFLDQRDNRRQIEALARGREVLNAFSFSGGFSLYAARGGARSVTDLDISAHALAGARRNFGLNQTNPSIAACRHEVIQADAFDWLQEQRGRLFDLIVLDPPSLAKRESERTGALQAYAKLARHAIEHLRRDGMLMAASCSAHVSAEQFFQTIREVAARSGRTLAELQTSRHPPDHPATFPEAEYLKCIYLKF
jgi:23S rRNA (cytosine1962-C5)-methyltransferase